MQLQNRNLSGADGDESNDLHNRARRKRMSARKVLARPAFHAIETLESRLLLTAATHPDLGITLSDGGTKPAAGQVLSYTVNYNNTGTAIATKVVLTETVPNATTFDSSHSTSGWKSIGGGMYTLAVGTLTLQQRGSATLAVDIVNPIPSGVTSVKDAAKLADDGTHGSDANTG